MSSGDNALGEFLRARRELLDPGEVGVPDFGRRRVPGLRREELALLAGVSSPYYTRLEQGRDRNPSPQILDAIGRALGLDEQATTHLHRLAEAASAPHNAPNDAPPAVEEVAVGLRLLLDGWTAQPAVIVGRYRDVLAANRLAQVLNPGFVPGRNLLRHVFLDPEGREYYLDWEQIAEGAVAGLRASAGTQPDDPRLTQLVGELSVKSQDFRQMWARHDVHAHTSGSKRYNNPFIGLITLDYETFTVNTDPGQTMFVFRAEPDSGDEHSLLLLAEIAAGNPSRETEGGSSDAVL
jgi:transcriptional regulator with XRE-family HTH domain